MCESELSPELYVSRTIAEDLASFGPSQVTTFQSRGRTRFTDGGFVVDLLRRSSSLWLLKLLHLTRLGCSDSSRRRCISGVRRALLSSDAGELFSLFIDQLFRNRGPGIVHESRRFRLWNVVITDEPCA